MTHSDQTKGKILDASLRLFSHNGYLGTTTREIAREAGIAECTIFKHFPTKLAIFDALVTSCHGLQMRLLLEDLIQLEHRDALFAIGKAFLEMLLRNTDVVRIFLVETLSHPERLTDLYRNVTTHADDIIESYFGHLRSMGELRALDIPEAIKTFKGMLLFTFQDNMLFPRISAEPVDWDRNLGILVDIFANGTIKR